MPALSERTFETGKVALNYAEGPESGPPLVLLHGVTRRWQDFLPIIPNLSFRWQVHALDLRGHGRSGRTPGSYRVIDYVEDVVAFLRTGLDEPAVLLGHSLGAMIAAAVTAASPSRVRALVLEDPPFAMMGDRIGETAYLDLFRGYQGLAGSIRSVEEVATALAEVRIAAPGQAVPSRLGDLRDATSLRFSAACLRQLDPGVLEPIVDGRWLEEYPLEAILRRIVCPTLLIQGDFALGGALPDDYAAELLSMIGPAAHVRLSGVGHQIHSMQTETMLRLVIEFLESLDGSDS